MYFIKATVTALLCVFFTFNCGDDKETNSPTINDGLLAYYPLEGNAKDESGNGKDGILGGECDTVQGIKNQAIRFIAYGVDDSLGGHVLLPNFFFTEKARFSYSLWVKEESIINLVMYYIYFRDDLYGIPYAGIAHATSTDSIYFDVGAAVDNPALKAPFSDTYLNHFVHYCLVYDRGTLRGYVNGVSIGQKAQTAVVDGIHSAIARAWYNDRTSTRFTGVIDEVRIYDRAISDAEVQTLFLEGGAGF